MALSSYNNYVTDLLGAGNDAFSNLYEVSFTLPNSSSSAETASTGTTPLSDGEIFTMRCKGFNHPEATAADPYRVRYLTAFVDWPTAQVNVTRTFDLEFRVDSNYEAYKKLHELAKSNFDPNTEFVDTNLANLEDSSFTVTVNVITNGSSATGSADNANNKLQLYEFKNCLIVGITPLAYKQGTAEPLVATASFIYGDRVDLQADSPASSTTQSSQASSDTQSSQTT